MPYFPTFQINFSAGAESSKLSNVVFSNSNGLSFGLNNGTITGSVDAAGGGLTNVNLSAGTTSNNLSNFVFSNSNNMSFGLNGSTITGDFDPGGKGVLTNINVSAGTTSNNLSAFVLSNSNDFSFGLNGSTVTITSGRTDSWAILPNLGSNNMLYAGAIGTSLGQRSVYFFPAIFTNALSADVICFPVAITNSSSAANSVQKGMTWLLGIYTTNATNATVLTQHYSTSWTIAASHSSNASWAISCITAIGNSTSYNSTTISSNNINLSNSLHGSREVLIPISSVLSPGTYWFALHVSTSGTAGNILAVNNVAFNIAGFHRLGLATNVSNSGFWRGFPAGSYSNTTAALPNAVSFSEIYQTGLFPYAIISNRSV